MVLSSSRRLPIVVHSHLRWSFVWQRPQQTHSRLAQTHRILFLEEPEVLEDHCESFLRLSSPLPNLTVATPVLSAEAATRPERENAVLTLLERALAGPLGRLFTGAVHWLYSPLMIDQIKSFGSPAAVVYDCMDELAQFAFAPPELREREQRLLERADVVFTGGYRLFLAKSRFHANVHFFGCGVDFKHFNQAAGAVQTAPDMATLPSPRMGYVGVIDERLDYDLLKSLAKAEPRASLVMVGPIVKVDPNALPKGLNIRYVGARDYQELPGILAGFDVCLMPFALNEATEYINPTKALEYLATGKPVVSTPVPDVVRNFGRWVFVADRERFAGSVGRVLAGVKKDPAGGLAAARAASWEQMTRRMETQIEKIVGAAPGVSSGRLASVLQELEAGD